MINCEFREIRSASEGEDPCLFRLQLSAVPDQGERINISGNPYIVFERIWALGRVERGGSDTISTSAVEMWCYLRVAALPHKGRI